jgi:hypothetical protein
MIVCFSTKKYNCCYILSCKHTYDIFIDTFVFKDFGYCPQKIKIVYFGAGWFNNLGWTIVNERYTSSHGTTFELNCFWRNRNKKQKSAWAWNNILTMLCLFKSLKLIFVLLKGLEQGEATYGHWRSFLTEMWLARHKYWRNVARERK